MKVLKKKQQGFTLIEILVVIGIIAILAAVVLIAINPARQFAQARNSQRESNINAILDAVGQYTADNKGSLPPAITTGSQDAVVLCSTLVPTYISALPTDPNSSYKGVGIEAAACAGASNILYNVLKDANGRVTVSSTQAELGKSISVTR